MYDALKGRVGYLGNLMKAMMVAASVEVNLTQARSGETNAKVGNGLAQVEESKPAKATSLHNTKDKANDNGPTQ